MTHQVLPEFYQEDPARIDLTMARLDAHASKRWIWNWAERDFAKKAINNLQKVKAKELLMAYEKFKEIYKF